MDMLAGWLVQQPLHILLIAAAHFAAWALVRAGPLRANAVLIPALLWLAYAGWEWLVVARTPEANIRVDLLIIWPVLALATIWAIARLVLRWNSWRRTGR
jgi:hypothetical protein